MAKKMKQENFAGQRKGHCSKEKESRKEKIGNTTQLGEHLTNLNTLNFN